MLPVASCDASSEYSSSFACENVLDGMDNTAWATSQQGIGSWIEFTFETEFVITQMFYKNRANELEANKQIQLEFSDGTTQNIHLNTDETTADIFNTNGVNSIRLTVLDVYNTINNGAKRIEFYGIGNNLHDCCSLYGIAFQHICFQKTLGIRA